MLLSLKFTKVTKKKHLHTFTWEKSWDGRNWFIGSWQNSSGSSARTPSRTSCKTAVAQRTFVMLQAHLFSALPDTKIVFYSTSVYINVLQVNRLLKTVILSKFLLKKENLRSLICPHATKWWAMLGNGFEIEVIYCLTVRLSGAYAHKGCKEISSLLHTLHLPFIPIKKRWHTKSWGELTSA